MEVKVLKVRHYKVGYEVRTEKVEVEGNPEVIIRSAYTPDGKYIGSPRTARYLIVKRGIKPELADPGDRVCTVGFCERENKWYGFSHRAICGFGIDDMIFEEKFGDDHTPFTMHGKRMITNLDEAREAAVNFAESVS